MEKLNLYKEKVDALIASANAFDIPAVMTFFAPDAVINDIAVGTSFLGTSGVLDYFERYFVGYETATEIMSILPLGDNQLRARADFTGNFGHEIGRLDMAFNDECLISHMEADLE